MRVFALSDIHVDYEVNYKWVTSLSTTDFRDDILLLAGDITDALALLDKTLRNFAARFKKVLFVPGNHDLWVVRDDKHKDSLQKFSEVVTVAEASGVTMQSYSYRHIRVIPLLGWYDYSFGTPDPELKSTWMDYVACRWPSGFDGPQIAAHFAAMNVMHETTSAQKVITFSHFLPRIDVMPPFIPASKRVLYPALGSSRIEVTLRALNSTLHVYGHSHVNREVHIDGVTYVNNAFGYPQESTIASKRLLCICTG